MASVLTFWQLPDDELEFFRYLARSGEVVAIRHREAVLDPSTIRPVPVEELVGRQDADRLYLTLRSVATEPLPLHQWQPESPGAAVRFSLPLKFPAIVYDAGTLCGEALSQSNAVAYPSDVPLEVAAWIRSVFGWLRRATPHWYEYRNTRVTEQASQAALGGLSLVPYHGWRGRSTGKSSFASRGHG
jgi:hypothetical protein